MQLPAPVRAAIGLAASAADEARHLPDRAIELPMLAVSTVLQLSLRAQQRYAALTARGDEVLRRAPGDEPPPWATFDEPLDPGNIPAAEHRPASAYTDGKRAAEILDEILGTAGIAFTETEHAEHTDDVAQATPIEPTPIEPTPIEPTPIEPIPIETARKKTAKTPTTTDGKRVSKPRHTAPSKFDDAGS